MKWGVRRYQNEDGRLTRLGKIRYNDIDFEKHKQTMAKVSDIVKTVTKFEKDTSPKATKKYLDLSEKSDAELSQAIKRHSLEKQYKELFAKEEPKISKGREKVREILKIAEAVVTVGGTAISIMSAIQKARQDKEP